MATYHIGLLRGNGRGVWSNGHRKDTLIVQARRSIDNLSCETWRYLGMRETTKVELRRKANGILTWINQRYGEQFRHIIIE